MRSITSQLLPWTFDAVFRHNQYLKFISRIDISFSCWSKSIENKLLGWLDSELGLEVVVGVVIANYLRIKIGDDHVGTTSLGESPVAAVTTDSVVSMDYSLAVFVQPSDQIEGVVGEEPSSV